MIDTHHFDIASTIDWWEDARFRVQSAFLEKREAGAVGKSPVGLALNAAAHVGGIVQNEQIKGRLDEMQAILGQVQGVAMGGFIATVAGIGVTAASTAILMRRMGRISRDVNAVADRIDLLSADLRATGIDAAMDGIETALDRLNEAAGSDRAKIVDAEASLHAHGTVLTNSLLRMLDDTPPPKTMVRGILDAITLSGAAQFRALIWLDQKDTAKTRATNQFNKIAELSTRLTRDRVRLWNDGSDDGETLSIAIAELRARSASQPSLAHHLMSAGVHGRDYVETIANDDQPPVLVLAAA